MKIFVKCALEIFKYPESHVIEISFRIQHSYRCGNPAQPSTFLITMFRYFKIETKVLKYFKSIERYAVFHGNSHTKMASDHLC